MDTPTLDHIAIIMDGNGRWAKKQSEKRTFGHLKGSENVRNVALAANDLGVKALSLYAFSTENWGRPLEEVNYLMKLPAVFFDRYMDELMQNNIRITSMGDLSALPKKTMTILNRAIEKSKLNSGMVLNFAMNYGSQDEIVRAAKLYADDVVNQHIENNLTPEMFESYLYTNHLPSVDLMIRTGGELRLSNFMLWQNAYSEFIFLDCAWPEFDRDKLIECVNEYHHRQRRFGELK